jgi:hypothetical protein
MKNAAQGPIGNLPTQEAIEAQLARILESETLSTSDRSKAFLAFVVRQSLLGKGAELKELVIGSELFGQSGFDPKETSSVRSAANRLRAKLAAYYAGQGRGDDVLITLPEGAYVPRFSLRESDDGSNRGSAGELAPVRAVHGIPRWVGLVFGMVAGNRNRGAVHQSPAAVLETDIAGRPHDRPPFRRSHLGGPCAHASRSGA